MRPPETTLKCKHKVCGLCSDELARHGVVGYCATCASFATPTLVLGDESGGMSTEELASYNDMVRAGRAACARGLCAYQNAVRINTRRRRSGVCTGAFGLSRAESARFSALVAVAVQRGCEALALDAQDAHAHSLVGWAELARGDAPRAFRSHSEAVRLDPSHASANYALGLVAVQKNDAAEAQLRFTKAIASDARHVPAHNQLAKLLKDDPTTARAESNKASLIAVNANPRDAGCLNNRGLELLRHGDAMVFFFFQTQDIQRETGAPLLLLG